MKKKDKLAVADIEGLMLLAARDLRNPAVGMGFQLAANYIRRLAQRAIESDDRISQTLLIKLGVLKADTPEEEERLTDELREWMEGRDPQ